MYNKINENSLDSHKISSKNNHPILPLYHRIMKKSRLGESNAIVWSMWGEKSSRKWLRLMLRIKCARIVEIGEYLGKVWFAGECSLLFGEGENRKERCRK